MPTEIEKKFLVLNDTWRDGNPPAIRMRQGYLAGTEKSSVRIRIEGKNANLNIKSATLGIRRQEYEYEIPIEEAQEMLDNLAEGPLVEKTRYHVQVGQHRWELDVFEGENAGLVVAEIELDHENEVFVRPAWLGREVSHDKRYYNVCLAQHPYKEWRE